jgi:FlaA1/EpsC-like NDP-sugar epimerase
MRTSSARARTFGRLWTLALVILDVSAIVVATILGYYFRFGGVVPPAISVWIVPLLALSVVIYIGLFAAFGLYRFAPRRVALDVLLNLLGALAIGFALLLAIDYAYPMPDVVRPVPIGVLAIQSILLLLGALAVRFAARAFVYVRSARGGAGRRIVIVGAGDAGSALLREIRERPDLGLWVLGFLDDNPKLQGRSVNGVKVLGPLDRLGETLGRLSIEEVILAMPGASKDTVRDIVGTTADAGIGVRIATDPADRRSLSLRDLRQAGADDLLAQEPSPVDLEQMRASVQGKVVAITGAGGSLGSELARQLVNLEPKALALIDIDESRLLELALDLDELVPGLARPFVGSVRDAERLHDVLAESPPDLVFHAAAYKQVSMMESAPTEAVATNVVGTDNVLRACARLRVGRVVYVSTTKAGSPSSVADITRLLAEQLVEASDNAEQTRSVVVRLGNVIGSRGSVVSILEHQLRRGGPLTVTDPDATRSFVAAEEAARLLIRAQTLGDGETFGIQAGTPIRILDLAQKLAALSGVATQIAVPSPQTCEELHVLLDTRETVESTSSPGIVRIKRSSLSERESNADYRELTGIAARDNVKELSCAIKRLEERVAKREASSAAE